MTIAQRPDVGRNKDILVLGGTRYFGRSIVEEFIEAGHRVTVFTRGNRLPDILRHVTHVIGDRRDFSKFRELFRGKSFDAVIDNIGYRPDEVATALDVFRGQAGLYIFTSTVGVYQNQYLTRDLLYEHEYQPTLDTRAGPLNDYEVGKIQCESKVAQNKDLPYVILRPSIVIGPDDHALMLYFFLQRILDGGPIILPKLTKRNLRHVYEKDLARIYPMVLQRTYCWNKAFNVAGNEVLTAEEYLGFIAAYVNKKLEIVYVPQADLDAIGYVQPFVFNRVSDISRLLNEIKVEMTPFKKWMATSIDWYLAEYTGPDSKGYGMRPQEIGLASRISSR